MFEKFGEMSSYTEINELAANLLQEGDIDSLKELAKENGIPDDYVEMYLEEAIPSLCDSTSGRKPFKQAENDKRWSCHPGMAPI